MPATLTYPGVYVEEIPSEVRTITGVATSISAFVGYTAEGPVNRAKRIFNPGDYERTFGGLNQDSPVSYAVQQFFLNGGADAYVVRVASGAEAAQVTLKDSSGTEGNEVLTVSAVNEGQWGNKVRLDVDYNTINPDSLFNLTVTRYVLRDGAEVPIGPPEFFRNLSMNSRSAAYAPSVVKPGSELVRLTRCGGLAFEQGYSLSKNLANYTLTEQETVIAGLLDGSDPFTLVLNAENLPQNIGELVNALNTYAGTVGLEAVCANADGTDNPCDAENSGGSYLKLKSMDTTERSAVQILPAPDHDASQTLGLGLENGGREIEGAACRRPLMTGTASGDLAGTDEVTAGAMWLTIRDEATGAELLSDAAIVLAEDISLDELAQELQTTIRDTHNMLAKAQVQLVGSSLRILVDPTDPRKVNLSATFKDPTVGLTAEVDAGGSGGGTDGLATRLKLTGSEGVNVQKYGLGTGAVAGGQVNPVCGSDGDPPGTSDLIGDYGNKTGIYALRDVDLFNLLCIPGTGNPGVDAESVIDAAASFCEQRRAFFLIDPDPNKTTVSDIQAWAEVTTTSRNAAVFFPQVLAPDPLQRHRIRPMPPSGMLAGVFARTDAQRGVWKAPAGIDATLRGVRGLEVSLTDEENGVLNPAGVNCLRQFPVHGVVSWGARTRRGADVRADEYKYIPVRRLALYLEESLFRGLKWVVFEPNDSPLWAQIRLNVGAFLQNLFRQGAFAGKTPREAYFVKCDGETTTQNDVDLGIVNILVGFAPLKPAEFVVIKLQQMAGQVQV